MVEELYAIYDEYNNKLADNMTWEMAMAFLRGYKELYYGEGIYLTIREIEDNCIKVKDDIKDIYKDMSHIIDNSTSVDNTYVFDCIHDSI